MRGHVFALKSRLRFVINAPISKRPAPITPITLFSGATTEEAAFIIFGPFNILLDLLLFIWPEARAQASV